MSAAEAVRPGAPGAEVLYRGVTDWWGPHVWVERDGVRSALPPPSDSPPRPAAYAWGRAYLAACQLARALLEDATQNVLLSERYCRDFTHDIIARLPEHEFSLSRGDIQAWIAGTPDKSTS